MPYSWNIKRYNLGRVLDIGCGIGRNLKWLSNDSQGIDINGFSVEFANKKGLKAFTADEFLNNFSPENNQFDTLLFSHILEHLSADDIYSLFTSYFPFLKAKGNVFIISPQELGYKFDDTHKTFVDFVFIKKLVKKYNIKMTRKYSFPFPRLFGPYFPWNEFIFIGKKL
ncbi:MAG: class I SAM-dependent methyltransferase [Candidatus Riflebacteria bacterium]|nr:class I SAM-dependent methyltransferase [Candidatus Riflebacteria bacterium]